MSAVVTLENLLDIFRTFRTSDVPMLSGEEWLEIFRCLHKIFYRKKYFFGGERSFETEDKAMRRDFRIVKEIPASDDPLRLSSKETPDEKPTPNLSVLFREFHPHDPPDETPATAACVVVVKRDHKIKHVEIIRSEKEEEEEEEGEEEEGGGGGRGGGGESPEQRAVTKEAIKYLQQNSGATELEIHVNWFPLRSDRLLQWRETTNKQTQLIASFDDKGRQIDNGKGLYQSLKWKLLETLIDDFRTFRSSSAHGLTWPKKAICIFVRRDGDNIESVEIFRNELGGVHAEVGAIKYLAPEGETQIYSSYSPCADCSDLYLDWLRVKGRKAKLTMTFAALYKIERESCKPCYNHINEFKNNNAKCLSRLASTPNIKIKTFREEDWVDLFKCLHWKYTEEDPDMEWLESSFCKNLKIRK